MRFRKRLFVPVMLAAAMWMGGAQAASQAATGASVGGASVQQVRELLDTIGLKRMLGQMNDIMVRQVTGVMPCIPMTTVQQTFNSPQAQEDIINRMIPVYQRHFSSADIQGLLTFYRSPLGQKVLSQMPATMQEGMQIGRQWGMQRVQAMIAREKQQGVLDTQSACPAPKQAPAVPSPTKH